MKKRIMCFGDSNTWGFTPGTGVRYDEDERWTGVLAKELGESYRVVEEGLNGRTTAFANLIEPECCGLHHIVPLVYSHLPLDYLIILLGTNDTKTYFRANATASGCGVKEVIAKAEYIFQSRNTGTKILLVAPVPIEKCIDGLIDRSSIEVSREIPVIYREIAAEMQCLFFNAGDVIDKLGEDGVHFTKEAHKSLGLAISEFIKENEKNSSL